MRGPTVVPVHNVVAQAADTPVRDDQMESGRAFVIYPGGYWEAFTVERLTSPEIEPRSVS